jgi:hypothetical protein
MKVKFDVNQLDSAMRSAREFRPSPARQAAGLFLSRLRNDGARRPIEIAKSVIVDPSVYTADQSATLKWLKMHAKR